MTRFDRLTEGEREKDLLAKIRGGEVTADNLEEYCLPFFLKIQIQTQSRCNGRCVMCPYPETSEILPQGVMRESTYRDIVKQLAGRGVERTSLFLMNEPLLDDRLEAFTKILKDEVPETRALIFTNGHLLTGERARRLAEAGMDEINVSVNGFDSESHARIQKGIDFDKVKANLLEVGELLGQGALGSMEVKVVGLTLPGATAGAERFREETGLPLFLKPVTNRAGLVDSRALDGAETGDVFRACQRPFVKAYVLYNGDMILCNCDWTRSYVVGNLRDLSLEELWLSPRLMAVRKAQLNRRLEEDMPCAACDYPHLI